MIRNAKSITYNLLYSIVNMKRINKKESGVLAKFCQLINSCRTEYCQESKLYSMKKSQLIFIQRSLYFIGNEVLLIAKKLENHQKSKISFHNEADFNHCSNRQTLIQDLIRSLSRKSIIAVKATELSKEIGIIHNYLLSVLEFLKALNDEPNSIKETTPARKPRKKSETASVLRTNKIMTSRSRDSSINLSCDRVVSIPQISTSNHNVNYNSILKDKTYTIQRKEECKKNVQKTVFKIPKRLKTHRDQNKSIKIISIKKRRDKDKSPQAAKSL
jgi:hypothetical protein